MDGAAAASSFSILIEIIFLDLMLSGDNALVIALACRRLPAKQAKNAAWMGAIGAILLRVALTLMAGVLLRLPFLQLASAIPLLIIALNLMVDESPEPNGVLAAGTPNNTMFAAAMLIVVSDAAMSVDNVVAVAAVARGDFFLLAFGLALSIPLIVFGSFGFSRLMQLYPLLVDVGGALLGWVAGDMIVGDPLFASWVKSQAPAMAVSLPLACAIFVLAQGRFARQRKRAEAALSALVPAPQAAETPPPRETEPPLAAPPAPPPRPLPPEQPIEARPVLAAQARDAVVTGPVPPADPPETLFEAPTAPPDPLTEETVETPSAPASTPLEEASASSAAPVAPPLEETVETLSAPAPDFIVASEDSKPARGGLTRHYEGDHLVFVGLVAISALLGLVLLFFLMMPDNKPI